MAEVQEVKPSRNLVVTAACVSTLQVPVCLIIHNFKLKSSLVKFGFLNMFTPSSQTGFWDVQFHFTGREGTLANAGGRTVLIRYGWDHLQT